MVKVGLKRDKITNYLARKHLSQNWLAFKIGISSGFISQLMSGKRNPSPKVRKRILEIFPDLIFDDLFEIQ